MERLESNSDYIECELDPNEFSGYYDNEHKNGK
jgi:hypothetical protein